MTSTNLKELELNTISIADPYDMLVQLDEWGGRTTIFEVSSSVLMSASPFWLSILDPDAKTRRYCMSSSRSASNHEKSNSAERNIKTFNLKALTGLMFPVQTVQFIFHIIHHRGYSIPPDLVAGDLGTVAVLVDAFECQAATEIYVERWIRTDIATGTMSTPDRLPDVGWIYVAKTFRGAGGSAEMAAAMFKKLVYNSKLLQDKYLKSWDIHTGLKRGQTWPVKWKTVTMEYVTLPFISMF